MIKIEDVKSKILEAKIGKIFSPTPVLIIGITPKSNLLKVTKKINTFFGNHKEGQVIILSKIKYLKTKGEFTYKKEIESLEKLGKAYTKKNKKVNTIRLGVLLEDENNYLNNLIKDIKLGKRVTYNEGNLYRYFISIEDVVRGIKKIIQSNVKGKIFNITLNKVTERGIVSRLIEYYSFNIEPLDNFRDKFSEKIFNLENNKLIKFKPEKTIRWYIESTLYKEFENRQKTKNKRFRLKIALPVKHITSGSKHLLGMTKTTVIALLFIGFLSLLDVGLDNYYLYKNIKNQNYSEALLYADKLRKLSLPTKVGSNYISTYNAIYYALNALNIANRDFAKNGMVKKETIASVMGISTKAINYAEDIDPVYFLTPLEKNLFNSKKKTIDGLQEKTKYLKLLSMYPDTKKEQTVLILIQNSNEIRPSGGFIGSYAVLKTLNLRITDYKFDDIYNIDGTLETKYPGILLGMPQEYLSFIKSKYLFARDVNLLLNSKQRNEILVSYFEKALETNIDYIVYVDLNSLKKLLKITGPIKLATYNKEITAENFDTLAQTYSEKNYYTGSTQKKNFLTLLGSKVLEKLAKKEKIDLNLLLSLLEILENKDIILYAKNPGYQNIIESLDLDGNTINRAKNKDYLYIVESNLGSNKVNKKTEKKVELKVNYDQRRGIKTNDLFITISNFSNNYNWPYGDYQGYLQVAIPKPYFVTQVKIKQTDTSKEIDIRRNTQVKRINNVNVVYIPFLVKPLEEIFITLSYETKDPSFLDSTYKIKVQKQTGAKDYSLKVSLNVPDHKFVEKDFIVNKDLNVILN